MDLEPDRVAATAPRRPFGPREQSRGYPAPAHRRRDRNRIKPSHARPPPEQDDGGASQVATLPLRHDRRSGWRVHEITQAPARQAIGGKHAVLKLDQRLEVAALGGADADG